jgi:predicted O-linked N-acetylglucosamine transferase (SPINDLY family)
MGLFGKMRGWAGGRSATLTSEAEAIALVDEGNRLDEAGLSERAMTCYLEAVRIAPNLARPHLNRGNALLERGDAAGAVAAYETVLAIDPQHVGAHFNMGNALLRQGDLQRSLEWYDRASDLDDRFVDAHVAAAAVLDDLGRWPEAIARYRRALAIAPDYAQVHSNLGTALSRSGQFDSAVFSHRRALEIDPLLPQALNNLGNALKDLGRMDEAEACYRQVLAAEPDNLRAYSNLLFAHNYTARHSPASLLNEAREYGALVASRAQRFTSWRGVKDPGRPLRVGLVSGDLRTHPVGYFAESVIASLAARHADRLELIAYPTLLSSDAIARRIRAHCVEWNEDAHTWSDTAFARRVHADAIDVLFDLSGHTAHNRLQVFAWKPAPVQVSWLGYFATTGVAEIDYLIADPHTLPETQAGYFTESIWRLPDTRLCFTRPDASPPVAALPALLGGAPLTFASFNNLSKVTDEVVALWSRVLIARPDSRLLLKAPQLAESTTRHRLLAVFERNGVDAARITFDGLSPRVDYLARYSEVDIALDTFPFTGGTTTAEALWMGVPVLTLDGANFLSRQGIGFLANAGLEDWIARDGDHFVELALSHAADLPRLATLRSGLRDRLLRSPVMDAERFADHLETALRAMWHVWCRKNDQP